MLQVCGAADGSLRVRLLSLFARNHREIAGNPTRVRTRSGTGLVDVPPYHSLIDFACAFAVVEGEEYEVTGFQTGSGQTVCLQMCYTLP